MEDNKNLTPETKIEDLKEEKALKLSKKEKKKRPKKLKNQAFLKRGGYSLAITAAVLAGIIILNILTTVLDNRFNLKWDMTVAKENSISKENIEYLKKIEDEIVITVCADDSSYSSYMGYYAPQYNVNDDNATTYYNQTVKLLNNYEKYNKNISVTFVDTQSSEFTEISSKYGIENLNYGDIIVSCTKDGEEKFKIVGFESIYKLVENSGYSYSNYTYYSVGGNNVETAVTSAISYVTSSKIKRAAVLTGHSANDYTENYLKLLKDNNYETTVISDSIVTSISNEYDMIIIPCPTTDFIGQELTVISDFLENDGNLEKGLVFFTNAYSSYLPNLYDFLAQWGIVVEEGVLFETNGNNHISGDPTTLGSYVSSADDDVLSGVSTCITGYNVPVYAAFENQENITVTPLVVTPATTVAAPKGTKADWNGADDYEKKSYCTAIQSSKINYDENNEVMESVVTVFGSMDFIFSEYADYVSLSNKDIVLNVSEKASNADNTGISFVSKYIEEESFADKITEQKTNVIRIVFMIMLPVALIAASIYIYIRRRNA